MKKVTINGNTYLGVMEETGKKIYLKRALQIGRTNVQDSDIEEYLRRKNLNTLEPTIELLGTNVQCTVSNLSAVQVLFFKKCILTMELAKKTAIPTTENVIFDQLLGK